MFCSNIGTVRCQVRWLMVLLSSWILLSSIRSEGCGRRVLCKYHYHYLFIYVIHCNFCLLFYGNENFVGELLLLKPAVKVPDSQVLLLELLKRRGVG